MIVCSKEELPTRYVLNTISIYPPGIPHTFHYNNNYQIIEISNFSNTGWVGTTFEYDANGNLVSGSNWRFNFDTKNRLIEIGRPPSERWEKYVYNAQDQLTSVTAQFSGMGGPPVVYVYTYTYSNTTTHNFSKVSYDIGATETFEYDTNPNPFKSNWPQLGAASFLAWDRPCYHTDNNITRSIYTEGTTTVVYKYNYEYNSRGYPVSIVIESHVTTPTEDYTLTSQPISLTYSNK